MVHCCVKNCSSRTEKRVSLFRFPKENLRRAKWVHNMHRESWQPPTEARLCEKHFEENHFEKNRPDGYKKLKPNAVPTLFDPQPIENLSVQKSIYLIFMHRGDWSHLETGRIFGGYRRFYREEARRKFSGRFEDAHPPGLMLDMRKHEVYNKKATMSPEEVINPSTFAPAEESHLDDVLAKLEELKLQNELQQKKNEQQQNKIEQQQNEIISLKKTIQDFTSNMAVLEYRNRELLRQVLDMQKCQSTFLNEAQIKKLQSSRIKEWSNEAIIKGLKLRFALSIHGYKYLLSTGYPSPSYSTLTSRIQEFKLDFGILYDVLDLLKFKVEAMDPDDRFCILSFDEMQIGKKLDFDVSSSKHFGYPTLDPRTLKKDWIPSENDLGDKAFLVIIKGVKNHWKQLVACHITRKGWEQELSKEEKTILNVEMRKIFKKFILDCVKVVESCGLYVTTLSSDMDARNTNLWKDLGIEIYPNGRRTNSFKFNEHEIFVQPDPCHLLKNLKSAMLKRTITLPSTYVDCERLPSEHVKGEFIKQLFEYELLHQAEIRLLHHIRKKDIEPTTFEAMDVGAACRFFTPKTASAIKTAIELEILPAEALTTAHFIELISDWFSLVSSKVLKTSITKRRCDQKYLFLHSVIDLFQCIRIESDWKPLNKGMVLCTISFCDVVEFLFLKGLNFVLGHRFTADAIENVISQVRNKYGALPSALDVLRAVRLISVSQFVSDVKRSCYMSASDEFLLTFCKEKKVHRIEQNRKEITISSCSNVAAVMTINVQTLTLKELESKIDSLSVPGLYYIAGSTTRAVEKHACTDCEQFLCKQNLPDNDFIKKARLYKQNADKGGLKHPCLETLHLILICEYYFNIHKKFILKEGNTTLIEEIHSTVEISFPDCCELKKKIIHHFFNVRSFCLKNFSENNKIHRKVYGTASAKRQKT